MSYVQLTGILNVGLPVSLPGTNTTATGEVGEEDKGGLGWQRSNGDGLDYTIFPADDERICKMTTISFLLVSSVL